VLERRDVMEFLERQPDAWPRLVEVLCGRLRATDLHMAEVAMRRCDWPKCCSAWRIPRR